MTLRSTSSLIWKAANVLFPPGKQIEEKLYKWETPKVTSFSESNDVFCKWKMALMRDASKCFSVAIVIEDCEKPYVDANLNVSLYSNDNTTLIRKFEEKTLKVFKEKYGEQIFVHPSFMTHSIVQQYYKPQDPDCTTVKIVCKADFSTTPEIKEETPKCNLQTKLKHWLETEKCTDVKFLVDGQNVKAHKVLLMAQSKVFEAMFTTNMTEKKANQVEIVDVSYEIFKEVIHYIYTEEIPMLNELAYELLQAADKYELNDLKSRCEHNLIEKLSVENAVQLLILANRHNIPGLKASVLKFFKENAQKILGNKDCENLINHPQLLQEILYTVVDVPRPLLKAEES